MMLLRALSTAAFALALGVASAAHAFTIDDQSNTTSSGAARYTDPDAKYSSDGSRKTVIHQGNTTFTFGGAAAQGGSFSQRYNTDRMFDPMGRPGDPDR